MTIIKFKTLPCDDQLSMSDNSTSVFTEANLAICAFTSRVTSAFNLLHRIIRNLSLSKIIDCICEEFDAEASHNLCMDSWDQAFANVYLLTTDTSNVS